MNYAPPKGHLRIVPRHDTLMIGVCTYRRPKMLEACLKALTEQRFLEEYNVQVVVVDNDETPSAKPVFDKVDRISPFSMKYVHHPERGIARARNAVLDHARMNSADWLVFIDDDEVADAECVSALLDPSLKMVAIVFGDRIPTSAEDVSRTIPLAELYDRAPAMSNIRFDSAVLLSSLRFDERLDLTGGEDEDFFEAAARRKLRFARTQKAATYAEVHPERFTFRRQIGKSCAAAALKQRSINMSASPFGAIWEGARAAAFSLIFGFAYAGMAALYIPEITVPSRKFIGMRTTALECGKSFATAAGHIAALFGRFPEPYRTTDGH